MTDRPIEAATLHQQIMNLPCDHPGWLENSDEFGAYDQGHRDARHAAAELVLASAPPAAATVPPSAELLTAALDKSGSVVLYAPNGDIRLYVADGKMAVSRTGAECEECTRSNLTFARQIAAAWNSECEAPAEATVEVPRQLVTEFNVGRWCLSEDECIAQGIDFAAYERGVADAAKAFGQNGRKDRA